MTFKIHITSSLSFFQPSY